MVPEKLDTKTELIKAAAELFSEKGYAAISTREVAEKAGVNLGAIQYHFGSKAQLFVETIRALMQRQEADSALFAYKPIAESREDAAVELCILVHHFMDELCHPEGPDACRMMHREVLGATTQNEELFDVLVSTVVEEFYRPVDRRFLALIQHLCPDKSKQEAILVLQSLYGQCVYYATDRPFIEGLRGEDYVEQPMLGKVCEHIAAFTLKGVGFTDFEISEAIDKASKSRKG